MNRLFKPLILGIFLTAILNSPVYPQGLLKKAGDRLGKEAERMLNKKTGQDAGGDQDSGNDQNQNDTGAGYEQQTMGSGGYEGQTQTSSTGRKKMTPPDVNKLLAEAEGAYKSNNINDTRYNVQQAITGIELEIGYQILNSMPKNIEGLEFNEEDDQVMSGGYGFVGFNVARSWHNNADKSMEVSIMNNATMISGMNMMLSNPGYGGTDNSQKSVRIGNYKGLLTAEENGDFTLGIPLGQSSVIMMTFRDFNDENEVTNSAGKLDIDGIKTMLGEQ